MVWFLHDEMKMNSLSVRIEKIATSRLWSSGICSASAVVYLQLNDSRRLIVHETLHKSLDTLDVIGDARSK
jgi:hypothetical protein